MIKTSSTTWGLASAIWLGLILMTLPGYAQWNRHVIDNSSVGADGIRVQDVNRDGLPDLATGWEEGGLIRVYIHPGASQVKHPWPHVTVGLLNAPEDAVFADLDGNGAVDVISCTEGDNQSVYVHWAPHSPEDYLNSEAWRTEAFPALEKRQRWMYCLPMHVDGKHGLDLVIGAKGEKAQVGWLQAPENSCRLEEWQWHPLYEGGWIMSIEAVDISQDGHDDLLITDRKGDSRSCFWLENPGPERRAEAWPRRVLAEEQEFMFLDHGDINQNGLIDVAVATPKNGLFLYRQLAPGGEKWKTFTLPWPDNTGTGKAVRMADIDQDGLMDFVFTCEHAQNQRGVMGLHAAVKMRGQGELEIDWQPFDIGGLNGTKFDLIQLLDLDADGDLDLLTCEENENLGVIWYENPLH